jgi:capsular polysaccharide export protein
VFVPFQERFDSQVLINSRWIRSMEELFQTVVDARDSLGGNPPALVFKEHPNCRGQYASLRQRAAGLTGVHFANGNATGELIAGSLGVVTINSSVGAEALLLDRPVLALGDAVYGIPGVAATAHSLPEVAMHLQALHDDTPPPAPLREAFLNYLLEDHLIPDRHQEPGPRHFAAAGSRFARTVAWGHRGNDPVEEHSPGLSL